MDETPFWPASSDRRTFAAKLVVSALAAPWAIAAAAAADVGLADEPAIKAGEGGPRDGKPAGKLPGDEKPAFNPVVRQLEFLVDRYPSDQFTPEGLKIIAGKLASQLAHSARLSEFPLDNSDGPGFVFSAYRAP